MTSTVSWLTTQEFSTFFSESFLDLSWLFRSDYFKYSKASVRRDQPSISIQWDPTPEVNSTVCCSLLVNVLLSSKALAFLGSVLVQFRCELHGWGILYGSSWHLSLRTRTFRMDTGSASARWTCGEKENRIQEEGKLTVLGRIGRGLPRHSYWSYVLHTDDCRGKVL